MDPDYILVCNIQLSNFIEVFDFKYTMLSCIFCKITLIFRIQFQVYYKCKMKHL